MRTGGPARGATAAAAGAARRAPPKWGPPRPAVKNSFFAQGNDTGPFLPPASPRGPGLLARGEDKDGTARAWGRRRRGRGRPPRPPKMEPPPPRG